jgi:hypothetical protein
MRKASVGLAALAAFALSAFPAEIHMSVNGKDTGAGTPAAPLRTIQRTAAR